MSEETVIRCCAPTLAAIKTGSLFSCPVESREELTESLRMVNRCLIHKDVRAFPLRYQNGQALIYLYRPQMLERDLQNSIADDILRDAGYTGWDGALGPVTQDTDLHAVYTETHAYELKFFNYDGTLLYTALVAEGATCPDPVKNNAIESPTKPSDANYVYSFLGWNGSLVNVRQDRTLTAVYSEIRSYAIVLKNADGTVLWTDYLAQNAIITDPIARGKIETPTIPPDIFFPSSWQFFSLLLI